MGSSQSQKEKIKQEVLNNTDIQMKLNKVNETINKSVAKVVNEVSDKMEVESNTKLEQEIKGGIKIKNIKDSEGVKVEIKQQLEKISTINITSLQDISQNSAIVNDLQKEIQNNLEKQLSSQQESASAEGEKIMKELLGAISGTVKSALTSLTGGKTSTDKEIETMIKNELKISNETEIKNKIQNEITTEMITKNLTELKTSLDTFMSQVVDGAIEIEGVENSKDIGIALKQEGKITENVFMKKINETAMSSNILSKIFEVDETKMKESIESAQKNVKKDEGTLQAAGGAISEAAQGVGKGVSGLFSGVFQSLTMPLLIIGVVGVVGLFIVRPLLSKGLDKVEKIPMRLPPIQQISNMKGGKVINKKIKKIIQKIINIIKKIGDKLFTFNNLIIFLILFLIHNIIVSIIRKKEKFTEDEVNKNYILKIGEKYLKREDGKIILVEKKEEASEISLVKKTDNFFLNFGYDLSITNLNDKVMILKNKPIFYVKQKVEYIKDKKHLKINEKYLSIKDNELIFTEEPITEIVFEKKE